MRRYVLVTYDIADEKRLRRMFKLLRGYGDHVQYSIFLCQLTDKDMVVLKEKMKDIINHKQDQAILIGLGSVEGKRDSHPESWQVIGMRLRLSSNIEMIY